ncbi:PilN domain-containing protein [Ningiella sp. W23]|uniref:PilN domain-containing protein n=1 Tax=Ningiella sp. W23 TaxID=3023715 RepID=UPI00375811A4
MKFNINLYHKAFHPKFEWLTGVNMFAISACVLALCLAGFAALYSWQTSLESEMSRVTQSIATEQQSINDLTNALQTRTGNAVLGAKLAQLQRELAAKDALLRKVQDLGDMKQSGFSNLFDAFANANSQHVWIRSFTVDEDALLINGSVSKPSALTQWIADLSGTVFFEGKEFDEAVLDRNEEDLTFQLKSEAGIAGTGALKLASQGRHDDSK